MDSDYYSLLGVERDASTEDIKRAFRKLARESHPDANPGDPAAEARFREIAAAYEVLAYPDKRRRYDRGDTIDLGDIFGGGFGGLDDLLRSVFGDAGPFAYGGAGAQPRGRDVLVRTGVSLSEAAFGAEKTVEFEADQPCVRCEGDGTAPGADRITCSTCGGAGQVRVARRSFLGTMMSVTGCPDCQGAGTVVTEPCVECSGRGVAAAQRSVSVEIPAGVDTGTRLRLTGKGEATGPGGASGDLFVEIRVDTDERFRRDGDDLIHHLPIGIAEATLGTAKEVPLIGGESENVDIPPGTQPGWTTVIRGEGMGRLGRRGRGDLVVVADVVVPVGLEAEQEDLLRKFASRRGEQVAEPSLWRRVRR